MDIISKEQDMQALLASYHNRQDLYRFLIGRGKLLPQLLEGEKGEEQLVPGCISKIWLKGAIEDGKLFFKADSDSQIAKGMVAIIVELFNGQSPEEVASHRCQFFDEYPFSMLLPRSKRNGMSQLIGRIYAFAAADVKARASNSPLAATAPL